MPEKEGYKCIGCGQEYGIKSHECMKCGVPVFDCCGLIAIIAKRENIKETKEYKDLEAEYNKLHELDEAQKLHPSQRREYEHSRALLKNMRKKPGQRTVKHYCPKCAKPIQKLLE